MSSGRGGRLAQEACLSALLVAVSSVGCVVQMYPGPKLPRDETARLGVDGASVARIDGMDLPVGSAFMVRSGIHAVSASPVTYGDAGGPVTFCFIAEGGASYVLTFVGEAHRVPMLIDERTAREVRTPPLLPGERCRPTSRPRPLVANAPAPAPAAPAEGTSVAAPEEEVQSIPDIAPRPDESAPPTRPESPAAGASSFPPVDAAPDSEVPAQIRPHHVPYVSPDREEVDPRWLRHPGNGFTLDFGAFFGGTDLATASLTNGGTSTLSGGSGVLVSVGLMLTPLWAGDAVGLGFDAFAGIKYDSLGDSGNSVSLMRYPLGLGAHLLLHVDGRWWFVLRGGIIKETGISLSASGYSDADLTGSLGGFGEGGLYYIPHFADDHLALVFTFRYSVSSDSANDTKISANSGGVIWALHINL